jgi:S-formylglutathione hydrolase FrmB
VDTEPVIRRLLAALSVLLPLLVAVRPAAADDAGVTFADAAGIHVVSAQQLDPRLWQLQVASDALGRAVRVRVLLPDGYAATAQRYPVLYLFHGTSGGAPDWTELGGAEASTDGQPLIVVMPDAGFDDDGGGWFTNWYDTATKLGPSQWETFHVGQLVPWVDANLRTLADRAHRAVAGLSQGGFGAMSYAARHPDTFGIAASFSGAPEIDRDPEVIPFSSLIIGGTALALDGVEADAMFGDRLTNEINWKAHDPATLIPNLAATGLYLWTGDGVPGPLDSGTPDVGAIGIESITHASTVLFHQHLEQAGIPSHYTDYGSGTHTWAYWARDLREFVPSLVDAFAHPAADPTSVTYEATETAWSQWGWTLVNHRPQRQAFSVLANASAAGFTVQAAGTPDVTTPARYEPGSSHTVVVTAHGLRTTSTLVADADGRLHVSVASGLGGLAGTATVEIS